MRCSRSNSYYPWETQSSSRTRYSPTTVVVFVLASLIIGLFAGYVVGSVITGSNDAEAKAHEYLLSPFLVSGNVSMGSSGIPRGITFDNHATIESSMLILQNGFYSYHVYLHRFQSYIVTIFYQDSTGNWQQCPSSLGTFSPPGPEIQN